jgi:hypothetical protein
MKAGVSRTLGMMTVTASLVCVAACCAITCPSPCTPLSSHYHASRTVTPPDGRPLARFDFNQTVNVDVGDNCPATDHPTGAVSLSITNLTAETVSFGYTVTDVGERGATVWTYSAPVTVLAPGATVSVGVIASSTVPVIVGPGPRVEATSVSAS